MIGKSSNAPCRSLRLRGRLYEASWGTNNSIGGAPGAANFSPGYLLRFCGPRFGDILSSKNSLRGAFGGLVVFFVVSG